MDGKLKRRNIAPFSNFSGVCERGVEVIIVSVCASLVSSTRQGS